MKTILRASTIIACTSTLAASFMSGCSSGEKGNSEDIYNTSSSLVARPAARLFLTPAFLTRLKARAAANDSAWAALKSKCDGYATGAMNPPSGDAYPNFPNVGQGYQGEEYIPPIMSLGLCYRVAEGTDAASAQAYGAAGGRLLDAMSTPVGSGGQAPSTDSGYGIRNYGVGMAVGFDWLYPALSDATRSGVITSLNAWIDWYDVSGFIRDQPIGNYFAGYFFAKTAAALATEGDNAKATGYFDAVTTQWTSLVKPAYVSSMAGGGWPEGWEYGPLSVRNMVQALWAVKTAKGLDWILEAPQAHDQALYVSYFAWPSLEKMDDQGTVRSGTSLAPSAALASTLATALGELGDPSAPRARAFTADITASGDDRAPWQAFLYSDPGQASTPYKDRPLSYFAPGPGHVAMRSTWNTDAAWGALSSGTYINAPDSGEQMFNQGSLSVVSGGKPVLANATGLIPEVAGTSGEDFVYADTWGSRTRSLYNTFFVSDSSNPYNPGQSGAGPSQSKTHVERYEDWGGFVRARAAQVEQAYKSTALGAFTRDLVFVRPGTFVLFDRTTVTGTPDQWMSFHTPSAPKAGQVTDASTKRFDIADATGTLGSIRTLLPRNATVSSVSLPGGVTRLEEHSKAAVDQQWLTVISASGAVPEQTRLSSTDGNVTAGNVVGVHVQSARNQVVLFPGDQAPTASTSSAHYTVKQTADADHVLVDVAAGAYTVTATASGGAVTVDVKQGGSFKTTPQGSLCYAVSTAGAVGPCAFGPPAAINEPSPAPGSGSGPADAGPVDTGSPDAGPTDPGSPDAGPTDPGSPDAGPTDPGSPDSGTTDPGSPDGGTSTGSHGRCDQPNAPAYCHRHGRRPRRMGGHL